MLGMTMKETSRKVNVLIVWYKILPTTPTAEVQKGKCVYMLKLELKGLIF